MDSQMAQTPANESMMDIGLTSFADVAPVNAHGRVSPEARLRNLIEEIRLADQVGLDVFGVGEHHRPDYAVSAPAVVLAAAASVTRRIRLASAVTVLSSDDPIRIFQQFATLDLLSGGRAEIMAGRGSFVESYPLFGQDLRDYEALFVEKLDLLLKSRESEHVTWTGAHRPSIDNRGVYPRPRQQPLPVWIAVGGTPKSAVRAGCLGLPMTLAIIGGMPDRFVPFVEMFRAALEDAGHDPWRVPLAINSLGFVAETSQAAADIFYPHYAAVINRVGRERGWAPIGRAEFDAMRGPRGALLVGSPAEVADKILRERELFGQQRFLLQMSMGAVPHADVLRAVELVGTKVAPQLRAADPARPSASASGEEP